MIQFNKLEMKKTDFGFELYQTSFFAKLIEAPEEGREWHYRSWRGIFACFASTKPNICCSVAKIAQVPEENFEEPKLSITKKSAILSDIFRIIYGLPISILSWIKINCWYRFILMLHLPVTKTARLNYAISYFSRMFLVSINHCFEIHSKPNETTALFLVEKSWLLAMHLILLMSSNMTSTL